MQLFFATKAVIVRDGKVLLLRESGQYADGTNAGKYDMPGGRLNPAEAVEQGLLREVQEETGLMVTPDLRQPFYLGEWWPKPHGEAWHVVCNFFLCQNPMGEVRLSADHDAHLWVSRHDWQDLPLALYIDEVLEQYWSK